MLLWLGFVSEGSEVSLECANQTGRRENLRYETHVEDEGTLPPAVFGLLTEGLLVMCQPKICSKLNKTLRGRPGRGRDGRRERRRGTGDVKLLGLGEDGDSSGILLEQVDLESLASGPTGGRCVHGGRTRGGGDVLLQNDVNVWINNLRGTN